MPTRFTKVLPILACLLFPYASASAEEKSNIRALQDCADHWENNPFGKITESTKYRKMIGRVRVAGIGSEPSDSAKTDKPVLILIEPSVSVLSKTTYRLLNPNGYYCFKAKVAVLSKTIIIADCKAHVSASQGTEVLGTTEGDEEQGVTVLGATQVRRINCADQPQSTSSAAEVPAKSSN